MLLETMAGKGTEVGRSFEELAAIIDKVQFSDKVGVCWIRATYLTAAMTLRSAWMRCWSSLTALSDWSG